MFGPTPLRDIFLVAGFELREMLRSRRAFLFSVLYLLVAALGAYGFVNVLTRIQPITNMQQRRERGPFAQNLPATPSRPAETATTSANPTENRLFERGSIFRGMLSGSEDEGAAVDFMASKPPITLFHLFISLMVVPIIIMITSSESIAQEHQSRGVRFIGLRTGRAEFVLGKLLGQSATIAVMTLLAGGVCMFIAWWKLGDFEFWPTLSAILLFWPRLLAYCIAFLGLAGLCSMNSSSSVGSRTFSIIGLVSLWVMYHLAEFYQTGLFGEPLPASDPHARVWHFIQFFSPFAHENEMWYPEFSHYGYAMIELVFLAALYVGIGLLFYRKRDL